MRVSVFSGVERRKTPDEAAVAAAQEPGEVPFDPLDWHAGQCRSKGFSVTVLKRIEHLLLGAGFNRIAYVEQDSWSQRCFDSDVN